MIAGLDIGTSNITVVVGTEAANGNVEVLGFGQVPAKGVKRGIVVNLETTANAIQEAVSQAEQMADCHIDSVYTSISGSHIHSLDSSGTVAIRGEEVTENDVDRALESAQAVKIEPGQQILHILPQEFIIDDEQSGILDPTGMFGVRLETKVHIVIGASSAIQNLEKTINRAGLELDGIVLEQLATSYAILSEDEREIGVCTVNIGGGTTDIVTFINGGINHTSMIQTAGEQITNDIAVALHIPFKQAEQIKIASGDKIELPAIGNKKPRTIPRQTLIDIVHPRYEELLMLIRSEIEHSGLGESIGAGIALTGGGAMLLGLEQLADDVLDLPVRVSIPTETTGVIDKSINPSYTTAVGLIRFASSQYSVVKKGKVANSFGDTVSKVRNWLRENL